MIFDYSKYLEFDAHYGEGFETKNRELIDVLNKKCPYCDNQLRQEYFMQRGDRGLSEKRQIIQWETINYCENDGWWQHKINEESYIDPKAWYSVIHEGILTEYHENSLDVPIEVLNDYIYKYPEKITYIHDKKMEELVSSVFRSFYSCEAKIVGKSSDGGVDVILIDSDKPTMVQVKRRKNINKTESVSYIRELLGATLLQQSKRCIFVTTANKFSNDAKKTASLAVKLGLVEKYELINYERFINMLKSEPKKIQKTWEEIKTLDKLDDDGHYGLGYL